MSFMILTIFKASRNKNPRNNIPIIVGKYTVDTNKTSIAITSKVAYI
jgi:hypothetical protein